MAVVDGQIFYFEDYEPGWQSSGGDYCVSEEEIIEFGRRFDPQPFHVDPQAARASHFGGLVASGCHVMCMRSALVHMQPVQPALVAGLGLEGLDLPNPVRPGDRIRMRVECVAKRASRSRPDRGIVQLRNVMENQDGDPVMTLLAKMLVRRRAGTAA